MIHRRARWQGARTCLTSSPGSSTNLVSLGTAHGNPLKVLLTEELDEATAKGPRALADYLAPTLQWCGLDPSLMGPLLNMREPLRSNVASWVAVTAAEGPPAATHATLQLLLRLYEQ